METDTVETKSGASDPPAAAAPASAAGGTRPMDPRLQGSSVAWLLNNIEVEIEGGSTSAHEAANADLQKAVKACVAAAQFGGKGTATLDISIKLIAEKGMIEVAVTHKTKLPKPMRSMPMPLFPTKDGGFSLENPRQLNMFPPRPVS